MTGIIKDNPFVERVKNGDKKALFAEVAFSHDDEVRTLQIFPGIGEDSWPCKGDIVVVEKISGIWYVAGIWDGEEPKNKPGELEFYSRNADRKRVTRVYLDEDGNIVIEADKDMNVTIKGDCALTVDGNCAVKAKKIDLN